MRSSAVRGQEISTLKDRELAAPATGSRRFKAVIKLIGQVGLDRLEARFDAPELKEVLSVLSDNLKELKKFKNSGSQGSQVNRADSAIYAGLEYAIPGLIAAVSYVPVIDNEFRNIVNCTRLLLKKAGADAPVVLRWSLDKFVEAWEPGTFGASHLNAFAEMVWRSKPELLSANLIALGEYITARRKQGMPTRAGEIVNLAIGIIQPALDGMNLSVDIIHQIATCGLPKMLSKSKSHVLDLVTSLSDLVSAATTPGIQEPDLGYAITRVPERLVGIRNLSVKERVALLSDIYS